jgi:hypothetical protein
MADEPDDLDEAGDVPEGAAVFPVIPAELGVDPLLLAVIHATVFLAGSDPDVVHPAAADEAIGCLAEYLHRLDKDRLRRVREDLACLVEYARQQKWPKQDVLALKSFLRDYGIEKEDQA